MNVSYVDEKTNEEVKSFKKSDGVVVKVIGDKVEIGNGSKGIINIGVYDTKKGKGHRWESLNVLDLVEFVREVKEEPKKEPSKEEVKDSKKKETKSSIKEDMNDDLPW